MLFYQANQDGDALSDFINQNKLQLQNEGLTAFIGVEGLKNETYFSHRKALREYLNCHKEILEYLRDNLEPIKRGHSHKVILTINSTLSIALHLMHTMRPI